MLIDMFSKIKDENFKFMIVGVGRILDDLKKQAEDLGISDRVIFILGKFRMTKLQLIIRLGRCIF